MGTDFYVSRFILTILLTLSSDDVRASGYYVCIFCAKVWT